MKPTRTVEGFYMDCGLDYAIARAKAIIIC